MFRVDKSEALYASNINANRTIKEKAKLILQSKAVKEFQSRSREIVTFEDYLKLIQYEMLKYPGKIKPLLKAISSSLIAMHMDESKPILKYEVDPTVDFDFYGSNIINDHAAYQYSHVYNNKTKEVNLYIIIYNWNKEKRRLEHAVKVFNSGIHMKNVHEAAKTITDMVS